MISGLIREARLSAKKLFSRVATPAAQEPATPPPPAELVAIPSMAELEAVLEEAFATIKAAGGTAASINTATIAEQLRFLIGFSIRPVAIPSAASQAGELLVIAFELLHLATLVEGVNMVLQHLHYELQRKANQANPMPQRPMQTRASYVVRRFINHASTLKTAAQIALPRYLGLQLSELLGELAISLHGLVECPATAALIVPAMEIFERLSLCVLPSSGFWQHLPIADVLSFRAGMELSVSTKAFLKGKSKKWIRQMGRRAKESVQAEGAQAEHSAIVSVLEALSDARWTMHQHRTAHIGHDELRKVAQRQALAVIKWLQQSCDERMADKNEQAQVQQTTAVATLASYQTLQNMGSIGVFDHSTRQCIGALEVLRYPPRASMPMPANYGPGPAFKADPRVVCLPSNAVSTANLALPEKDKLGK
ncbi:hypothetical protein CBS101457_005589 [Exobasidium rhododendri]|nr:hypothetical protein CBS101457_005589 [Exobasidium rhododendri]